MAHIDSGKTTLTESILHASEYVSTPGSVDTGSTTTDFLPAERERGITIQSASIPVHWKNWSFNLIDTPGHADFGMEVESASRVVDGAVVLLDGVEGVEAQTKGVWSQLNKYKVPTRLLFVNKMDRAGTSLRESLLSVLASQLHPRPVLLCLPVASFDTSAYQSGQPGIEGIVDIVRWKASRWMPSEDRSTEQQVVTDTPENLLVKDHPLLPCLKQARTDLVDLLSVHSPDLLDEFLASDSPDPYLALSPQTIIKHMRHLTLRREILPVLCGSALHHIGTKNLMDYIGELLASPTDVSIQSTEASKRGFVSLLAWKVGWDRQKGWLTFVRVYAGTLTKSSMIYNIVTRQKERVSKLLLCYAAEQKEVDSLPFGSVGVILGLKHTRTGDTLISTNVANDHTLGSSMQPILAPPATISAAVIAQSQSDIQSTQEALTALSRTDPSVRWTEEDGQTLIHGLGALHLEIVEGRLKDEFAARCSLGRRRVSYMEAFSEGQEATKALQEDRDVMGKHAKCSVELTVSRMEEAEEVEGDWGDNLVVDADGKHLLSSTSDQTKMSPEVAAIIQGLQGPLSASPHSALPITRTKITIKSYSISPGSPPAALSFTASSLLRSILLESDTGDLLEPFIKVKVAVPENFTGKVIKDLTEHGGEIQDMLTDTTSLSSIGGNDGDVAPFSSDGVYIPPAWVTPSTMSVTDVEGLSRQKRSIYAIAPLSKMLDYQSRLRAVSGGQASFEMSRIGFRQVDPMRKVEILQEIGRA